ncbi:hypothetical protein ADL22_20735 [Streptomyces sp. NRRL F-4489]|uniref:hypothetical protein n=1 Tax=Streptomyces sp. NRRL F-4489 TaxID=1609095 RepID=UPI00074A039B|nr:hypothetical protein [Streptomyces sp. NRRL F-4489]KUL37812.1 hypothetical protein ADL22_20735 [Streptomyces sp. NRRL F-4489]
MSTEDTPGGGETPETQDTPDTPETSRPERRERRGRRTPLVAASVAAAVLLAGGGAAYWAASASGGSGGPAGAAGDGPPPLVLDSASIAVGEPAPNGGHYRIAGALPEGPRSAPVYRPAGEVGRAAVERLAKALDVAGTARPDGAWWTVGGPGPDGRGATLRVGRTGAGSWTFSRYGGGDGVKCPLAGERPGCPSYRGGADGPDGAGGDGGGGPLPEAAARRAAAPVLAALGQPGARLDAHQAYGAVRVVTADPVIGGLPTYGWQSRLQIGADGQVVGGSGELAAPVKGAEYPVRDARATLAGLNSGGGARTPAGCPTVPTFQHKDSKTPHPGGIAPCEPAPDGRHPADEVTGAVFGLAARYAQGGTVLVPSWLYTVRAAGAGQAPGSTSVVAGTAVDPRYLRGPGPAGPRPSEPGATAMALSGYTVSGDGRTLTVHFWGGVCSTYEASARESAGAVRVTVTGKEKHPGQICVKIAKDFTKTVALAKPLDGRKVVDASSGAAVPLR